MVEATEDELETRMLNTSITLNDTMVAEIHERREKGSNRSEYIRDALIARFAAEDADEWTGIPDELREQYHSDPDLDSNEPTE